MRPWEEILGRAVAAFGGSVPSPSSTTTMASFYTQHPRAFIDIVADVNNRFKRGHVRSPWGVVLAEISKRKDSGLPIVAAGDLEDRFRLQQAEAWLANAGGQFPTWEECADELFARMRIDRSLEQHLRSLYDNLAAAREAA